MIIKLFIVHGLNQFMQQQNGLWAFLTLYIEREGRLESLKKYIYTVHFHIFIYKKNKITRLKKMIYHLISFEMNVFYFETIV